MGRRRRKVNKEKEHIAQDILLGILKTGAILSVALIAPNAVKILESFLTDKKEWNGFYPSSLERQVMKLWRKGFVEVREAKDGHEVIITEKGKTEILKYNLDNLSISKQENWDGKWRMVFFDIPEGHETARREFRKKLRSLGFFPMQKSVYIFPYPCEKEIKFLREVYSIPHNVKLAKLDRLENDLELRNYFRL